MSSDVLAALSARELAVVLADVAGERGADQRIADEFDCDTRTIRRDRTKAHVIAAANVLRERRATTVIDATRELGALVIARLVNVMTERDDEFADKLALAIARDGGLLADLARSHAGPTDPAKVERSLARVAELDELDDVLADQAVASIRR
jgi:hypothetical protein